MKFIVNKDRLEIDNLLKVVAGSLGYYEADVEFDESWDDLVIKAVMIRENETAGRDIGVINNKLFIDQDLNGTYSIGFVGYRIENAEITYRISTDLKLIHFNKGAGEIKTKATDLPNASEWEIYLAQIEEMLGTGGTGGKVDDVLVDGVSVVRNKIANIQLKQAVISVLMEYGLIQLESLTEQEIQALNDMNCTINENGELTITYDETVLNLGFEIQDGNLIINNNINAIFSINNNGEMEVNYE